MPVNGRKQVLSGAENMAQLTSSIATASLSRPAANGWVIDDIVVHIGKLFHPPEFTNRVTIIINATIIHCFEHTSYTCMS